MSANYSITQAAELPALKRTWFSPPDENGVRDPVDLSALTLSLRIGSDPPIEKTDGVTGDANGVVTVTWTAGELDSIAPGSYAAQVWARNGSNLDRVMDDLILTVKPQIAVP